jgi:23S rRNA (adenine2503-C2)-methyltransferase
MSVKKTKLRTGYLLVDEVGQDMALETLSIGDYGKEWNVKADFLGYTREINGVPNRPPKPMSEKWVMTLSTQFGCPMRCTFCDVPNIKFKGNVSYQALHRQVYNARWCFPEVSYTERLNIHFARMGEPAFNADEVFRFCTDYLAKKKRVQENLRLRTEVIHPVFTTSLPKSKRDDLYLILHQWCRIKNETFNGQAGLQLSINSTNDEQRDMMFAGKAITLEEIAEIGRTLVTPVGRKYCLNFAYSTDFEVDAARLRRMFRPEKFMVKITPIHNNNACREREIRTLGGYDSYAPYRPVEEALKEAGFDVLVFVPSMDEENDTITCGNAVLAGSRMRNDEQGG